MTPMLEGGPTLTLAVYAKVNLTLEVLGRRTDGYHEVRTVLQSVSLCDRLTLRAAPDVALSCADPALAEPNNLALRAARLLAERCRATEGVHITLEKGIPVAAGLGGGSADGAATLVGLNQLWGLHLPHEELLPLAAQLGSDVSFFLQGGTALASGRGEIVAPLPPLGQHWLVVLTPPITLPNKTARLYAALTPEDYRDGSASARLTEALRSRQPLTPDLLVNSFTTAAWRVFPELEQYAHALREAGAGPVHLSGAGPSLFSLVDDATHGEAIVRRLAGAGYIVALAHTMPLGWSMQ